jgi:hypothetical protein
LAVAEKELQQVMMDNQALARYINAKGKKEEARKKEEVAQKKPEEETHKKVMEGQRFKDVRT